MVNTLNTRRMVRFVIKTVCIALLIVGLIMIGFQLYDEYQRRQQNDDLQGLYYGFFGMSAYAEEGEEQPSLEPEAPIDEAASDETASDEAASGEMVVQEDFAELIAINEHLVGWLECGEDIALPIVYLDNEFYLDHDFYGEYDEAGTVFINEANTIWPADKNLLFHGHNMRSGSVFGNLDNFRNVEYLRQYPVISWRTIYDAEPVYYVPVALFDASMEANNSAYFDIGRIWFNTDEEFVEFADSAIAESRFTTPFDVQADDTLITLITCSYEYDNSRFIIVARALREGETIEGVTELMQQAADR